MSQESDEDNYYDDDDEDVDDYYSNNNDFPMSDDENEVDSNEDSGATFIKYVSGFCSRFCNDLTFYKNV